MNLAGAVGAPRAPEGRRATLEGSLYERGVRYEHSAIEDGS